MSLSVNGVYNSFKSFARNSFETAKEQASFIAESTTEAAAEVLIKDPVEFFTGKKDATPKDAAILYAAAAIPYLTVPFACGVDTPPAITSDDPIIPYGDGQQILLSYDLSGGPVQTSEVTFPISLKKDVTVTAADLGLITREGFSAPGEPLYLVPDPNFASAEASQEIKVDTDDSTYPINIWARQITNTSIEINWSAVDGAKEYTLWQNANPKTTVTANENGIYRLVVDVDPSAYGNLQLFYIETDAGEKSYEIPVMPPAQNRKPLSFLRCKQG
jgi:hypothetical protein